MASRPPGSDDELLAQMEAARQHGHPVEAVFTLRPEDSAGAMPAERVDEVTRDVLERVSRKTGVSPDRVNVLRNLASLVVSAKPEFLEELIDQPEVETAIANRRSTPVVEPPS